jgi:hypothetical protein
MPKARGETILTRPFPPPRRSKIPIFYRNAGRSTRFYARDLLGAKARQLANQGAGIPKARLKPHKPAKHPQAIELARASPKGPLNTVDGEMVSVHG